MSQFTKPVTGGGSGITQLTGDVTAGPGSGSQAATVASVGGKTAAQVATGVNQAGAAISALTGDITASGPGSASATLANDVVTDAKVAANAAIQFSKMEPETANSFVVTGGTGFITTQTVSANSAVATDVNGFPVASSTTDTELGYLSGTTSSVQTQIDGKVAKAGDTMTGNLIISPPLDTGVFRVQNNVGADRFFIDTQNDLTVIRNRIQNDTGNILIDSIVDVNNNVIQNVGNPSNPQDATPKSYVDTNFPLKVATVALTGQNTDLGPTHLETATNTGLFRVSVYLVATASGTATITATINWTDDSQAQSASTSPLPLVAGGFTSSTFVIEDTATSDITYSVTDTGGFTTDAYSIYITVEQL